MELQVRVCGADTKLMGGEASGRSYGVYVIELQRLPNSLYVGQSHLSPADRLRNHLAGHKSARIVRRHGGHLRPDLYEHLGRFARRAQAEEAERALADALRRDGFTVYGGH